MGHILLRMNEAADEVDIPSYSVWRATPSLSPMTKASAVASVMIPATMLLQILVTWPKPGPPQCTIFLPIPCNSGSALAKVALSPPHMKVSVAASAPATPPDTGASSMAMPRSAAAACTARALSTSMVELSINTAPASAAAITPAPRNTLRTLAPTGSMVTTKSTPLAASSTEVALLAPDCTTKFTASSLRSNTLRLWPALIRLRAIGAPMLPTPMNPTRAMMLLLTPRARARGRRCHFANARLRNHTRCAVKCAVACSHLQPWPAIDHHRPPDEAGAIARLGPWRCRGPVLVRRRVEVHRHILP